MLENFTPESVAAQAATRIDTTYRSLGVPIYMTNNYRFMDVQQGADACMSPENGHCYTRISNPTNDALGESLAALEGGEMGLPFATGIAAVSTLFLTLLRSGDHILCDNTTYSATAYLVRTLLPKFGVESTVLDFLDTAAVRAALKPNTKLLFFETPCNPTMKVVDIEEIGRIAKSVKIVSAIDNTFATPYNTKPIKLGIDIVMHSTTKYICGHGDAMGGALVGPKDLIELIQNEGLKNLGGAASPFNSYLMIRGIKTLELRMERHSQSALTIAKYLENHPKIVRVYYPGLESHPQHETAKKQMKSFGGMLAFEFKGGLKDGVTMMNNLNLCILAVSLGEIHTLAQHPASMTHWYVPEEARLQSGITDSLVRMSVGLENVQDIISDLDKTLELV